MPSFYLLLTFSASLNKLKESKTHDEGRKKKKKLKLEKHVNLNVVLKLMVLCGKDDKVSHVR
jgi:hypothetical protein